MSTNEKLLLAGAAGLVIGYFLPGIFTQMFPGDQIPLFGRAYNLGYNYRANGKFSIAAP